MDERYHMRERRGIAGRKLACLVLLFGLGFGLTANADQFSFLPTVLRPQLILPKSPDLPKPDNAQKLHSALNVLDYVRENMTHETIADLDTQNPGYNRRDQFGGWITTDGCVDTRAEVLIRSNDPAVQVKYKDAHHCAVVKGLWHDPYAGDDYKLAKAIQIDHVVPLKHVYLTGGKDWSAEKRCYYANFTHNEFHLLAVAGHENMAKADKSPEFYLPPSDAFQCEYVADWMRVKTIWQLISTPEEISAIEDVIRTHHCSVSKLQITQSELAEERDAITSTVPPRCREFGQIQWARDAQLELPFGQ